MGTCQACRQSNNGFVVLVFSANIEFVALSIDNLKEIPERLSDFRPNVAKLRGTGLLIKTRLILVILIIIVGTKLEFKVAFMIGSDLNINFYILASIVGSGYDPIGIQSSRSFMSFWTVKPRITTNSTFTSLAHLILKKQS